MITVYDMAKAMARVRGYNEYAEDFAGWLMQSYSEGKRQHQKLDHSFIDWLRATFGEIRWTYKKGKRVQVRSKTDPLADRSRVSFHTLENTNHQPASDARPIDEQVADAFDFALIADKLKPEYRTIIKLMFEWGLTMPEICDVLLVSNSMIYAALTKAQEIIRSSDKSRGD